MTASEKWWERLSDLGTGGCHPVEEMEAADRDPMFVDWLAKKSGPHES